MKNPRILIVDGQEKDAARTAALLAPLGAECQVVSDGQEAAERAVQEKFDAVITEYRLEGLGGLALLHHIHKRKPRLPLIVLTSGGGSHTAIEAIKLGAYDFLAKPAEAEELQEIVADAIRDARQMSKPVSTIERDESEDVMIGRSRAMTQIYKELGKIAATPVTVLVRGETGTGKELIARALYQHGHRAHLPLVTVNCAAIPDNLIESELFGHERGAFTGAVGQRIGKFELAHNATLFLDEIGDLNLPLQAKLLRVLQERTIQRVGGKEDIPADARLIAATHQNLEKMVAEGRFRGDLFYRLNVASLTLPPLRERREDIPLLIEYFVGRFGRELSLTKPAITKDAVRYLCDLPWPGNIRQLQNVLRKALLKSREFAINRDTLSDILRESEQAVDGVLSDTLSAFVQKTIQKAVEGDIEAALPELNKTFEKEIYRQAIQLSGGNQAQAARWLGVTRFTMREKLTQFELRPKRGK
ncbi:MAG: sigma-54 dependent transcriptional regulator [Verrucomicrobiota bacterium]